MRGDKNGSAENIQVRDENESRELESSESLDNNDSKPEVKEDLVSYDSLRRVLGEKKREQEEKRRKMEENARLKKQLNELLEEKSRREEEALKSQNDWKALAEKREEELKQREEMLKSIERDRLNAKKLDSFLQVVGGNIDRKYWGLIDLDKVLVNPDTGEVDEMTVAKVVENYKKEYPETLGFKAPLNRLPTDSPQTSDSIDYDKWKNMSVADMKKNLKKVMASDQN